MPTQQEAARISALANDIAAFALQRAREQGCPPRDLIRGLSAATIAMTTSLSLPDRRMMALITLSSQFCDDVLKVAKAIEEDGDDDSEEGGDDEASRH